jgi:phospholipid/cholesterol/gamma-HCH transport system substrate-binding protein
MPAPLLNERTAPYKTAGLVFLVIAAVLLGLLYQQFRGGFTEKTPVTMMSPRSGLVLDPGSKVTYNGVEVGRVAGTEEIDVNGVPEAKITLNVNPKFIELIPRNVYAEIKATTVFGNKYVAFDSPKHPVPQLSPLPT